MLRKVSHSRRRGRRAYKVLDTFAGAGGFSLGFQQAGFRVIGAIERDEWAADTFRYNHPAATTLVGDIQSFSSPVLSSMFPVERRPDVVLGGPPCQGYSVCRRHAGDPRDPRNTLFSEFVRMADVFEPFLMVMENVPNITKAMTSKKQRVIDVIVGEMRTRGFHVYYDVLQATDFGVPQIRRRLFVVASRVALKTPFPKPTHSLANDNTQSLFASNLEPCPSLWNAISDLPGIDAGQGAEEMPYADPPENEYQRELRMGSQAVFNHKAMNHSLRIVTRFRAMKWGESVSDIADHLKPYARNSNGVVSGRTYDQNSRRMHPNKPCHTIPASFYANFVHPFRDRNFTAREGARLQSFPDMYVFKGKPTVVSHKLLAREERYEELFLCQYNQIGNAVPPLLAKALAQNLLNQLE